MRASWPQHPLSLSLSLLLLLLLPGPNHSSTNITTLWSSVSFITSIAFSNDGQLLFAADGAIVQVFNASTGAVLPALVGHAGGVAAVAAFPSSTPVTPFSSPSYVLTAGQDSKLHVWDPRNGSIVLTIQGKSAFSAACISADGTQVAAGDIGGIVTVFDALNGTRLFSTGKSLTMGEISALAFAPNGSVLAGGDDGGSGRYWDAHTGAVIGSFGTPEGGQLNTLAFSPDSTKLLIGAGASAYPSYPPSVAVRNTTAPRGIVLSFNGTHGAYSSDGTLIAVVFQNAVNIYAADTGAFIQQCEGPSTTLSSVALSPSGTGPNRVVAGSRRIDTYPQMVQTVLQAFDIGSGRQEFEVSSVGNFYALAISPDSKTLATGSDYNYNAVTHIETLRLWDTSNGSRPLMLADQPRMAVHTLAFSPRKDDELLAVGTGAGVTFWDTATGEVVPWSPPDGFAMPAVRKVAISPTSKHVAVVFTGCAHHYIPVFEHPPSNRLIGNYTDGTNLCIQDVIFSPDGSRLAAAVDDTVRVWDLNTGRLVDTSFINASYWAVTAIAYSPDSRNLGVGFPNGTISVWEVTEKRLVVQFTGHKNQVISLAFSPDGKYLVSQDMSGNTPGVMKVWDLKRQVNVVTMFSGTFSAVFSSTDPAVFATIDMMCMQVWRIVEEDGEDGKRVTLVVDGVVDGVVVR